VSHEDLVGLLGKRLTIDEAVDRITMMGSGPEGVSGDIMTFDIFPNRPDLYSVEGIARGLRGYLSIELGLPAYRASSSNIDFMIDPSVREVRPHAVGGVVRGLDLDDRALRSIVDLQEKLHTTTGRRRRKVAIGIHDLDRVRPPFTFKAVSPGSIRFTPLGRSEPMDLGEILRDHEKGREYGPILGGHDRYPVIVDREGEVLSFPPVINGIRTLLTTETRNVFVDVTGTDADAVSGVLTIVATALAERGGRLETVHTIYPDRTLETPDLVPRGHALRLATARALLGLDLTADRGVELLKRMRHDAHAEGETINVLSPSYRLDLLHEWDLAEDVAIAWGYDRYPRQLPQRPTIGSPLRQARFTEALRLLFIGYGYQEVLSLTMADAHEPVATPERTVIANPVNEELTTLRSSLLPSLLNLLKLNKHRELPQRIFEIGEVVVDGRNVSRAAAAAIHHRASFTEAKSLVLSLLRDVGKTGEVEPAEDENFIPGRVARASVDGHEVGRFGEIHPRILEAYSLSQPVLVLDMDLRSLLER
jgi:phenylalanyl-tRNA synthetase beta chain